MVRKMDKTIENCINWPDQDDENRNCECLHGIMESCLDVGNFDLDSPEQVDYLVRKHCVPCLTVYNATKLDSIEKTLKLINKKLIKIEKKGRV